MKIEEINKKLATNQYIKVEESWLGVENYRIIEDKRMLKSTSKLH